jgi:peptidoglycan/xylan/chitin deacetylase (PgdA/CDA1 family)
MLHRVYRDNETHGGISVEQLDSYLAYLEKNQYKVLTMSELQDALNLKKKLSRKCAVFTIDDGFLDHYQNAAPVFDKYKMPLNFFLITDFINKKLWPWDDQVSFAFKETKLHDCEIELPNNDIYHFSSSIDAKHATEAIRNCLKEQDQTHIYDWIKTTLFTCLEVLFPSSTPKDYLPMSWENAQSLHARGHGVYPHTVTHRILSQLPNEVIEKEISESAREVREKIGPNQNIFVYPTGRDRDFNQHAIDTLKKEHIAMAFSTEPNYTTPNHNQYALPRFSVSNNRQEFLQYLTKFEQVKNLIRSKL